MKKAFFVLFGVIFAGLFYLFRKDLQMTIEIVVFAMAALGAAICAFLNLKQGEKK